MAKNRFAKLAVQGAAPVQPVTAETAPAEAEKKVTLRLNLAAWRELKMLALDDGSTLHDHLIDAVNGHLQKHGRAPVAAKRRE